VFGITCCYRNGDFVSVEYSKASKVLFTNISKPTTLRPSAKYIIWSRVDQKTCFKALNFVPGIQVIILENVLEKEVTKNEHKKTSDQVIQDLSALEQTLEKYPAEDILAICSTTSVFAPRAPDEYPRYPTL
jgi:hypothetical protein